MQKDSRPYTILKYTLLAGGLIVISALNPTGGTKLIQQILKNYFKNKSFQRKRFLSDLKRLQDRKMIDFKELDDGNIKITLTKQGKEKVITYKLDELKLKIGPWDERWRLVMFDIPHYNKRAREAFRIKIKELGFYSLQKSVYVTPYSCDDEIDFLCSVFQIDRSNILLIKTERFEGDEKLVHYFKL